jgi:hypothetical protein
MVEPMTAISFRGDKRYIKALKAVAAAKGINVGELVRSALDATYGDLLKPHIEFFATQSDHKNGHNDQNNVRDFSNGQKHSTAEIASSDEAKSA